jgi:hypothetical protein
LIKTEQASLQQPFEFVDSNKTIYSYIDDIFSCEGGFYSVNQITIRQTPGLGLYILFTVLLLIHIGQCYLNFMKQSIL